ncbi:MAG: hypothetical protein QM778_19645 [Myxococcales bacterium]
MRMPHGAHLAVWVGLALAGCGGGLASGRTSQRIAPGEPCDPAGPLGALLDSDLKPIDVRKPEAVEIAAGHPVLACVTLTQSRTGRVIDERTRAPIASALIMVKAWQSPTPVLGQHVPRDAIFSQETKSDVEGRWQLGGVSQWMAGILAADGLPFVASTTCIQAQGYQVQIFDPWRRSGDANTNLSEVVLKPGPTLGCP